MLDSGATELARRNGGSLRERLFALIVLGEHGAAATTYALGKALNHRLLI